MWKKILVLLVCISLVTALYVAQQNDRFARENRQVEITVDHQEIMEIIRQSGVDRDDFLTGLQKWGVTSIAVRESSLEYLEEYSGLLHYKTGTELMRTTKLGKADPVLSTLDLQGELDPDSAYLLVDDAGLAETVQQSMALKLKRQAEIIPLEEGFLLETGYFIHPDFRVTLDRETVQTYRDRGFYLVPRPDNAHLHSPEAVSEVLERFAALDGISTVVFDGPAVTGHPAYLDQTDDFLQSTGRPVGVIKYIVPQHGMAPLMEQSDYPSVLVHSNYPKVPPVLISSSVVEDNIRLLYVRFDLDRGGNLAQQAEETLTAITGTLEEQGYSFGPARPMEMTELSRGLLFVLGLGGVLAPGLLLLDRCLEIKNRKIFWILLAAGTVILALALLVLNLNTAARLLSLSAAMLFPALAVISQQLDFTSALYRHSLDSENRSMGKAMIAGGGRRFLFVGGAFFKTVALALAGGVIAYALTAGPYFLSGTAVYRGVKIAYLVPLALVFIHTLTVVGLGQSRWRLSYLVGLAWKTLNARIQLRQLLFFAAAGLVLYFYVLRSGHTEDMTISSQEVQLRYFFLEHLVVRPRFKELLVGHPLALLALSLVAWRGLKYPLLTGFAFCAGAIGAISIVNSFLHWTTPVSISLFRTLNSLWIGLLVGVVLTALLFILIYLAEKWGDAA